MVIFIFLDEDFFRSASSVLSWKLFSSLKNTYRRQIISVKKAKPKDNSMRKPFQSLARYHRVFFLRLVEQQSSRRQAYIPKSLVKSPSFCWFLLARLLVVLAILRELANDDRCDPCFLDVKNTLGTNGRFIRTFFSLQ